jgi:DNA recombination protein RmuC
LAVIVFVFIVTAVAVLVGLLCFARVIRRELSERSADVDRRLSGLSETVDRRLGDLDGRLLTTQRSSGETATKIEEKLGKLAGTAAQMLARANDLARLEQALRPPKARGGFGELLLENLLRDRLPPSGYAVQHTFSSGDRVDAVVRVGQLISVDSKFPLDNYERIVEAATDEERLLHEKAFARDVRNHVDAIAGKYIRPEDGTYDFAFMYIPVEAVYYELACGRASTILEYAHRQRVFPVSPTTFTAYLQVIVLGMRGMQIEQRAQEVMAYVAELGKDFGRFKEDFDLVGTHLGRAQAKFADADKRLDKFEDKLGRASQDDAAPLEAVEAGEPPLVIEAA